MNNEENIFLDSKETARFFGISEKQLRNLTSMGKVPYFKFGRLNRYKLSDLKALIQSQPRGPQLNQEKTNGN